MCLYVNFDLTLQTSLHTPCDIYQFFPCIFHAIQSRLVVFSFLLLLLFVLFFQIQLGPLSCMDINKICTPHHQKQKLRMDSTVCFGRLLINVDETAKQNVSNGVIFIFDFQLFPPATWNIKWMLVILTIHPRRRFICYEGQWCEVIFSICLLEMRSCVRSFRQNISSSSHLVPLSFWIVPLPREAMCTSVNSVPYVLFVDVTRLVHCVYMCHNTDMITFDFTKSLNRASCQAMWKPLSNYLDIRKLKLLISNTTRQNRIRCRTMESQRWPLMTR